MAKTQDAQVGKPKSNTAADAAGPGLTVFERSLEHIRERPGFYTTLALVIGALVMASVLGVNYFQDKQREDEARVWNAVQTAASAQAPAERLTALTDLESQVKETPLVPYYWWLVSTAAFDAAVETEDVDQKITYYQRSFDAAEVLASRYQDTAWVAIPWKTTFAGGEPEPSLVRRRMEHCKAQIAWLEQHKAAIPGELKPDPDVTAALVLVDTADPTNKRELKIRVFSKAAPFAVENFVKLVRDGRWKGSHVYGLLDVDPNQTGVDAVLLGSAFSKAADRHDVHGNAEDWVGYTLPVERSRLQAKKGRVAFDLRRENNTVVGASPAKLVIYTSDEVVEGPDGRVIFGEVEGSDETLEWLANLSFDEEKRVGMPPAPGAPAGNTYAPRLVVTMEDASVSGAPENPPPYPLNAEWKDPILPAAPEKEEPEDKTPVEGDKDEKADPNK